MDFELSEDQKMLVEMCRDFAIREIRPVAWELDKKTNIKDCWSWELVKKATKLGLKTAALPKEFGGSGLDLLTTEMMWEELAYGDGGFAFATTCWLAFGFEMQQLPAEVRDKYMKEFLEDDTYLTAHSLSEPRGMTEVLLRYEPGGFDSYAVRKGDEYIINGAKAYCSGAPTAKALFIHLRTDRKGPLTESWSEFFVPVETAGLTIGTIHNHTGFRLLLTSELAFDDMHIPASHLLGGKEGHGDAMFKLDEQIIMVFKMACLLGVCRGLYDEALNFARTRVTCGKPIIQHDTIKVMLADMRMRIAAAKGLVRQIAWNIDRNPEKVKENVEHAYLFKAFICDMVPSIVKYATEIHGGMGIDREMLTEKLMRDAFSFLHGLGNTTIAFLRGAPTLEV